MKRPNVEVSNLNSHMVRLKFTTQDITKGKKPPKDLQIQCRTFFDGENQIMGKTEILEVSGKAEEVFSQTVDVEFIFKRKQIILIDLIYDQKFQAGCAFNLGQLVGTKDNSLVVSLVEKDGFEGSIKIEFEAGKDLQQSIDEHDEEKEMFFEYLSSDLNISVITCIDFTASNGYFHMPNSLHRIVPGYLNDYQAVITSVCEVLLNYDSDKLIQTYGFGGCPSGFPKLNNPPGKVSHFFPLTGDWSNCAGEGIKGVFDIYTQALSKVELSGPTFFAPMFKEVLKFTELSYQEDSDNYTVLLVITDGSIHDINRTIDEIIKGSELPLSIIIVGVGDADFRKMNKLDSDGVILKNRKGDAAKRDIVQFVPFNEFRNLGADKLAETVLEELPNQVCEFLKLQEMKEGLARAEAVKVVDPSLTPSPTKFTTPGSIKSYFPTTVPHQREQYSNYTSMNMNLQQTMPHLNLSPQKVALAKPYPPNPNNSYNMNSFSSKYPHQSYSNQLTTRTKPITDRVILETPPPIERRVSLNDAAFKTQYFAHESYYYPHSELQQQLKRRNSTQTVNPNKRDVDVPVDQNGNMIPHKSFDPTIFDDSNNYIASQGMNKDTNSNQFNSPESRNTSVEESTRNFKIQASPAQIRSNAYPHMKDFHFKVQPEYPVNHTFTPPPLAYSPSKMKPQASQNSNIPVDQLPPLHMITPNLNFTKELKNEEGSMGFGGKEKKREDSPNLDISLKPFGKKKKLTSAPKVSGILTSEVEDMPTERIHVGPGENSLKHHLDLLQSEIPESGLQKAQAKQEIQENASLIGQKIESIENSYSNTQSSSEESKQQDSSIIKRDIGAVDNDFFGSMVQKTNSITLL